MQLDPIKPTLKAPGTKRLKLKCDEPLSKIAFNFDLRRYIKAVRVYELLLTNGWVKDGGDGGGGGGGGGKRKRSDGDGGGGGGGGGGSGDGGRGGEEDRDDDGDAAEA